MNQEELEKKLSDAYDKMMERVHHLLDTAEQQALPTLQKNIEKAKQQAIELQEVTAEEAEKVAAYIERDLHEAASYLQQTGREFTSWLNFDLQMVEQRVLDLFAKVADKTRLELDRLSAQAHIYQTYHTGEISTIGTLVCDNCGNEIHFKKTGRIPPCGKCHHTSFKRLFPNT